MRVYQRIGPRTGVSASFGELGFWGFLIFLGALPFIAFYIVIIVAAYALAFALMIVLVIYGTMYHRFTGKDARVPVPGSSGDSRIEAWMEERGWIRLPTRMRSM